MPFCCQNGFGTIFYSWFCVRWQWILAVALRLMIIWEGALGQRRGQNL